MAIGSILQIHPFDFKPSAPPSGQFIIYVKTDNTIYIQDSSGTEFAFGSTTAITQLSGEATGIGPGNATVTLSNSAVIGKVLTGFTSGPNSTVLATDTILQAIQKLQAQATAISGTTLVGDVTGTLGATVVSFVGGKSAAQVSTSVDDTIAATSVNTSSTIVKRDASGNFSATTITANLSGNATTATTATSFSGSLVGDVTGTQGATVVSTVGGKTASQVSTSVDDTLAATASNTSSTIVKRDASGNFAANTITANLTGTASGNEPPITATTSADYYRGDKTFQPLNAAALSNFDEAAQDAIGSILTDSSKIDFTYNDGAPSISATIVAGSIADGDLSTGINANKIGAGTVSNTEFGYLAGVTSAIQTQINGLTGSISSLTGDVTATGPGAAAATVVSVGGSSAANVNSAELLANAATSANTPSTIVKRDGSGDFSAGTITANLTGNVNGVDPAAHASRHLPSGADALTTAAPLTNLNSTSTNAVGTANSLARSDHSHAIDTGTVSTQTPDQSNAAGSSNNLAKADHIHNIPSGSVVQVGTSNFAGAAASFALSDHVHAHGNQTSGTLHAAATTSVNGFMSSTDKTKLDDATASNTPNTLVLRDGSGNFTAGTITAALTGAASANLLKAGDSMTGYFRTATVALSDGANIATDAALGNIFTVTIAGNRTFDAPTNPLADQKITYKIRQDAVGGRVITWNAAFNFGVDLSGVPNSTSANTFDYYGFQYNSTTSKWDCLAISRGY